MFYMPLPGNVIEQYKSTDGGETWKPLKSGIPKSNLGKIGLAMSPFNPEVVYAAIELDRRKGGVFMTRNGRSRKDLHQYEANWSA